MTSINNLTVAQNAVKLVLRKEGKPVDALLLILPELSLDLHRDVVLLHFTTIQQLHQELPFLVAALQ